MKHLMDLRVLSDKERVRLANESDDGNLLKALSEDENKDVKMGIASNINTPKYILEVFAKLEDLEIKKAVIENSNTPPIVLFKLMKDPNEEIAYNAFRTVRSRSNN